MKHRRRKPSSGVSSSPSNIARAMRGRNLKVPNFPVLRNQHSTSQANSPSELVLPQPLAPKSALLLIIPAVHTTQNKRFSDRNRRSPSYHGFKIFSSFSAIAALPKPPRSSGDVDNYQPTCVSVVETLQTITDQLPEEGNLSPVLGELSPHDPQICSLVGQPTPTLDKDV